METAAIENSEKIILLGDSVAKGVMFSQPGNAGKGKFLLYSGSEFDRLSESGLSLINRSHMGATVKYATENADKLLSGLPEEGFGAILEFGGNDCDFNWSEVALHPECNHLPNTPIDDFKRLFTGCVEKLRSMGARVAVSNLIPIDAEKYFDRISTGKNGENILHWLGDKSMLYRWQEYYSNTVEELARSLGCPLIDIRGAFLRSHDYPSLLSDDGIHPSAEGHSLIRNTICTAAAGIFRCTAPCGE